MKMYKTMIINNIKDALKYNKQTTKVRTVVQTGSGRYAKYSVDHTKQYCKYLDSLNIAYTTGNDAQRGGQLGNFIEIVIDKDNEFIGKLYEQVKHYKLKP